MAVSATLARAGLRWWMVNRLGQVWSAVVVAVSVCPHGLKAGLRLTGDLHPSVHVAAFCAGALLVSYSERRFLASVRFIPWLVAVAFASEFSELMIYRSRFEWADVGFDITGVLLGLGLLLLRNFGNLC